MRDHHLVAKARGDHQVGLGQAFGQQPAGADFAAEFFVVSKVQFHRALERQPQRFERAGGKSEGGKVALAHRCGAAVHGAVVDFPAIGVVRPAFTGGHHVAVGVQCNGFALTVLAPHDQVGDGLQAAGLDLGFGYRVLFCLIAKGLEQFGRALGVRGVVARRGVCGHLHQRLQKLDLLVEVGVDPGVELLIGVGGEGHVGSALSWFKRWVKASMVSCMSSQVVDSSGLWLMPAFSPRTNSMACGMISWSFIAS